MNILAKTTLLALAGVAIASQSANALTYTPGDILLGFRTSTKDYVIDLGNYSQFTLATTNYTAANVNADLTTLLGSGWATNTGLSWGAIGYDNYGGSNGLIFASKGETVVGTAETGWSQVTKSNTTGEASKITTFIGAEYTGQTSNTFNLTGIIQTPDSTSTPYWTEAVTGAYTGWGNISFGTFNPSIEANATGGTAVTSTQLDLFKMGVGSGAGAYQGNFTLATNGDVVFNAVPEPSTYAMLGVGAIAFLGMMRRRSVKA